MNKKKGIVYYDEECRFCTTSVRLLKSGNDDKSLEYQPYQNTEQIPAGLTRQDIQSEVWLVMPDGRKYGGFYAVRCLAWRKPLLWPFALLLWLPGMSWLGPKIYRWVARNRHRPWGAMLS